MLKDADTDGSGSLSVDKILHVLKKVAACLIVLTLFLSCTTLGTSIAAAVLSTRVHVQKPANAISPLLSDSAGTVVATTKATTSLPLMVAPVMSLERLETVERLRISYEIYNSTDHVSASLAVRDVFKYSDVWVKFELESGGSVQVKDSHAKYATAAGVEHALWECSAQITCSAFTVDNAADAARLVAHAEEALKAAGINARCRTAGGVWAISRPGPALGH